MRSAHGFAASFVLLAAVAVGCAAGPRWRHEKDVADRLVEQGRLEAAAARYASSVEAAQQEGSQHGRFAATVSLADLWTSYPQLERRQDGLALWRQALDLAESTYGLRHHNVGYAAYYLAQAYEAEDLPSEAVEYFDLAVAIFEEVHGLEDETTRNAARRLQAAIDHAPAGLPKGDLAQRVRAREDEEDAVGTAAQRTKGSVSWKPTVDWSKTYLAWNALDTDGMEAFVHATPDDMPLRVAIGYPHEIPLDGSKSDARDAAISAMRLWQNALAPHLPWFQLEFVEEDERAPVQVEWKRRMTGSAAGRGGIRYQVRAGRLHVGGAMTLGSPRDRVSGRRGTLDQIRLLVAHEFGHVLGLHHCLDCDSIMNYSWETRNRTFVTALDVLTFRALVERPNGLRADGRLMNGVNPPVGSDRAPEDALP